MRFKICTSNKRITILPCIGFVKIFDFRFLMDLYILECPDHDLTISGKCLYACLSACPCVCDKNFVASVARELMQKISGNFIFGNTLI